VESAPHSCEPQERRLRTLRVSVTSRCDLDCAYCNAPGHAAIDTGDELTPDEIALIAEAAALAGATRIRLTGGEPLAREDIVKIVSRLRAGVGEMEIALTTNAQGLATRATELARAGLDRVNIGLPSLSPEIYRRLTGGEVAPALAGLDAALEAGLTPVKLNVVVTRGANEPEIPDFVALARERPVEVRFIERMPFAGNEGLVPASDIREALARALDCELGDADHSPTAAVYRPEGFAGAVGVISSVTEPFCARCDRLRVTSEGALRSCLSEPGGTDLRAMLRAGASAEDLSHKLGTAFGRKPGRHNASFSGSMRGIGG
jgi:cyclic pyranopterin phosphate synthase